MTSSLVRDAVPQGVGRCLIAALATLWLAAGAGGAQAAVLSGRRGAGRGRAGGLRHGGAAPRAACA